MKIYPWIRKPHWLFTFKRGGIVETAFRSSCVSQRNEGLISIRHDMCSSLAFLDINISIEGNGLCTSVYYKPTDSHSYLLYSSSHPSHFKNFIPFSLFLRVLRLCGDDSDFSEKSEAMCQFFDKRGYPISVVQAGHHRAQQIDRQSALQTAEKDNTDRIPIFSYISPSQTRS